MSFSFNDCKRCYDLCGGKSNILLIENCITRVRIKVSDISLVDMEGLESLPSVKGLLNRTGEVHLIVGLESYQITRMLNEFCS